jgi:hypothetical protein
MRIRVGVFYFTDNSTKIKETKTELRGLSLRANYTDPATAARRRRKLQLLRVEGCYVVSVTDPNVRNLVFLDRSRYLFFQAAPQLFSLG